GGGLALRIVPQGGHNSRLANAQAFAAELRNFLVNPG
ncbi:2-succinyl-6-hydroxy-2,4-cyclohexadiene-1-carboxylate synthase, partial [Serratia quinivorans]